MMRTDALADVAYYIGVVDTFLQSGVCSAEDSDDAIMSYLTGVMTDPELRESALADDVNARIFRDSLIRFVDSSVARRTFHANRKQSEQRMVRETSDWSVQRRKDGCEEVLRMLEPYTSYGFRMSFFTRMFADEANMANDELWENLYADYCSALFMYLREQVREDVRAKAEAERRKLMMQLKVIPEYLRAKGVEKEQFFQVWGLMGGNWSEFEFERYLKVVRVQKDYPVILELAAMMGRMMDAAGDRSMWVGSGNSHALVHSSRSDIEGVTVGSRLDSLLPAEAVLMADEEFDELFLLKYSTSSLQSFLHRSNQISPNKRLERRKAKQNGPMIACLDTSGSMSGFPEQVARSLLIRLVELANVQSRPLYVIAYSVSSRPVDVKRDRVHLLKILSDSSSGDTNPTQMMTQVLELLDANPEYMSADVVMVGDFRMKVAPSPLMERLLAHRKSGIRVYGLQIGIYQDNPWESYLDRLFKVATPTPPKYLGK